MMKVMRIREALESGQQVYMAKYDVYGAWKDWKPVDAMTAQAKSYVTAYDEYGQPFAPYRFAVEA